MFGADISNLVDGKGRRSGKAARAADPRASDAASARGQDPTASSPPKPDVKYYQAGYEKADGRDVYLNDDGTIKCIATPDPLDEAIRRWKCEQFLPPMPIDPPKSTPLGVSWINIMIENLDRKIDEAVRKERGEEADGDDDDFGNEYGEDGFAGIRSQEHLINYKIYLQRQREAAAEKAEEREKESARKRKAREERRAEREAGRKATREAKREAREAKREEREAEREADREAREAKREEREAEREADREAREAKREEREAKREEREAEREADREAREAKREEREAELPEERKAELAVKRSLGVRALRHSAGFYGATVEVDGEMCCIGIDFMSHAAATRDAAMVVRACGGVIPDGILSDADVDMADGFIQNPTFLVKKLREKWAGLLDVKEVSLKVMLDAKLIKSGKSTLFIRRYASRYVADLRDDGTIVYAGETYAGPWKWVNFIVNGSGWGGQVWERVRYGKEDGPTLKQLRQAHVEGRSSDDVVAAKSKPQLHPDERPDKCTHCGESLFCEKKNRRNATKGPAGPGTLCAGCGDKLRKETWFPDPDNLGKLKPTKRAYSVKKQKVG
jgi:hypothetical protein